MPLARSLKSIRQLRAFVLAERDLYLYSATLGCASMVV